MRVEKVRSHTLEIPFREPVVSAARRWDRRRVVLLTITTDAGVEGVGEFAAPEPGGLGQTAGPRLAHELEGTHLADPVALEASLRRVDAWPFVGRVARSAVESALVDLLARAHGRSVAASLASDPAPAVAVNGLIGLGSVDTAVREAGSLVGRGFRCLKLKGGDEPVDDLVARIEAVRVAVGPAVDLRLDLNGSLEGRSATAVLERLAPADLEYVEQPIAPAAGGKAMAALRERSPVPIAADESVRDLRSARILLDAGAVDVLVVKPARVGGLRQGRSIVELAATAGVRVTVSTLFETGVGIAGALHLAATVPGEGAHGLATADLLESDLLEQHLSLHDGRMIVPGGSGLGVTLDPVAIERYRVG
jgi:o-succinylbenzoate synthase